MNILSTKITTFLLTFVCMYVVTNVIALLVGITVATKFFSYAWDFFYNPWAQIVVIIIFQTPLLLPFVSEKQNTHHPCQTSDRKIKNRLWPVITKIPFKLQAPDINILLQSLSFKKLSLLPSPNHHQDLISSRRAVFEMVWHQGSIDMFFPLY